MIGVVVALLMTVSGYETLNAAIVMEDGFIRATNDNQVHNALLWQTYTQHPGHGSCILYEDFSLGGDCSREGLDPDGDLILDGYRDYTTLEIDYD